MEVLKKICPKCGQAHPLQASTCGSCGSELYAVPTSDETVPCKFCGEQIQKTTRKCPFCDEYQIDIDRARFVKHTEQADPEDKIRGFDIAACLICPQITCIFAIVWMVQGKAKGWKMLLLSLAGYLLAVAVWAAAKRAGL